MGGIGGPAKDAAKSYHRGAVGVVSRSGGMTTEMSSTLSAAGLGVSTAVSIGGDAIRWVTENNSRLPIVAFMAGRFMDEMPGMSFGHAGTIVEGKEDTASEKIARLAQAGITVAERIEDIPALVKEKVGGAV
jgi:succinyl-CoA synthetase alpha subunit